MGPSHIRGEVTGTAARPRKVTFLIDSGAGFGSMLDPFRRRLHRMKLRL